MMEFGRERVSFSHAILRTSRQRKYPPYKEGEFVVIVRLGGGESSVTEVLRERLRDQLPIRERAVAGSCSSHPGCGCKKHKEQRSCLRCSPACTLPQVLCQY